MAGSTTYSLIYCMAENALLAEEADVSYTRTTGAQIAKTVVKGMAGMTPGSPMIEGEVTNMLPASGPEVDMAKYMLALKTVKLAFSLSGGKTQKCDAYIIEDSFKHSVDNPSAYTFKFVAPWNSTLE